MYQVEKEHTKKTFLTLVIFPATTLVSQLLGMFVLVQGIPSETMLHWLIIQGAPFALAILIGAILVLGCKAPLRVMPGIFLLLISLTPPIMTLAHQMPPSPLIIGLSSAALLIAIALIIVTTQKNLAKKTQWIIIAIGSVLTISMIAGASYSALTILTPSPTFYIMLWISGMVAFLATALTYVFWIKIPEQKRLTQTMPVPNHSPMHQMYQGPLNAHFVAIHQILDLLTQKPQKKWLSQKSLQKYCQKYPDQETMTLKQKCLNSVLKFWQKNQSKMIEIVRHSSHPSHKRMRLANHILKLSHVKQNCRDLLKKPLRTHLETSTSGKNEVAILLLRALLTPINLPNWEQLLSALDLHFSLKLNNKSGRIKKFIRLTISKKVTALIHQSDTLNQIILPTRSDTENIQALFAHIQMQDPTSDHQKTQALKKEFDDFIKAPIAVL